MSEHLAYIAWQRGLAQRLQDMPDFADFAGTPGQMLEQKRRLDLRASCQVKGSDERDGDPRDPLWLCQRAVKHGAQGLDHPPCMGVLVGLGEAELCHVVSAKIPPAVRQHTNLWPLLSTSAPFFFKAQSHLCQKPEVKSQSSQQQD